MFWIVLILVLIVVIVIYFKNREPEKKIVVMPEKENTTRTYFRLLDEIEDLQRKKSYKRMLEKCEESVSLLPAFVKAVVEEYGNFDIDSIPCIPLGLRYWVAYGQIEKINKVKDVIYNNTHLKRRGWGEEVEWALKAIEVSDKLYEYIKSNPGTLQNKIKIKIGENDGTMIAGLLRHMDRIGRIKRVKANKTYQLYIN